MTEELAPCVRSYVSSLGYVIKAYEEGKACYGTNGQDIGLYALAFDIEQTNRLEEAMKENLEKNLTEISQEKKILWVALGTETFPPAETSEPPSGVLFWYTGHD